MNVRYKTLSDQLIKNTVLSKEILLVTFGATFVGLLAKVSFPGNPVPISFSPQAALFVGAALGCRKGILALLTYIGMGVAGLPVFSVGFTQGFARLIGPTGGYLIGFVLAAGLTGYFSEKGWNRSILTSIITFFLGNTLILFIGWMWLSYYLGSPIDGFYKGIYPFVVLDMVKAIFMSLFLPAAWNIIKKV